VHPIDPWGLGPRRAQLDRFWETALVAFAAEVERACSNDDEEENRAQS
jgi:hypothetical protein